ncbi:MAG: TraB/GumN family protein [Ginsengibacter sp.]
MIRSIWLGCFFACLLSGCNAQKNNISLKKQDNNNTLLWEVSGKDLQKPSFLFGTFHLLCKDEVKFSAQLKSAMQFADSVYMELDLDDPSTMMSGLLYINMKNDKKLKDFYTTEEYKKINEYFSDSLHMPMMMFQKAKPYFLVALLYPKMMKCKTFSGVDEEVMKLAKQNNKQIAGLETMEFQSSIFDSIPYELQAKELLKNIDSLDKYKNEFDTLMQAYKSQQLNTMEKLMNESEFGMEKYENILVNYRNANWVKHLKTIMKTESVFVAVGAGHLLGKKGLINLLRAEGYVVEPIENE